MNSETNKKVNKLWNCFVLVTSPVADPGNPRRRSGNLLFTQIYTA